MSNNVPEIKTAKIKLEQKISGLVAEFMCAHPDVKIRNMSVTINHLQTECGKVISTDVSTNIELKL